MLKHTRMRTALAAMAVATAWTFAPPARAAFIASMQQVGSDVVMTGSGSINLADMSLFDSPYDAGSNVFPNQGLVKLGPATPGTFSWYISLNTGPGSLGTIGQTFANTGSGDYVAIYGNGSALGVPVGYVSNTPLVDTATFTNASFASLGVTPGLYVWTWGSATDGSYDTFTLQIDTVPEPATALMLGVPVAFTWLARRRPRVR